MRYGLRGAAIAGALVGAGLLASLPLAAEPPAPAFTPPPDSAIPDNELGAMIRLGKAIFTDTGAQAPRYVGNTLKCVNCHLDAGRADNSGPLAQAYVSYPAYRKKNGKVNTYEERLQGCFRYSMNGTPPPSGDKVLVALTAYSFFLATGAPTGVEMPGRGYVKLAKPALGLDFARGEAVFKAKCAMCHGKDGAGRMHGDQQIFPALWGPTSYNWGAGMEQIDKAAGFIKMNMPWGQGNTLSDQDAWDVAAFIDSHERPQDPRFTGDVAATRQQFHDTPMSMYGRSVNGAVLGANAPPAGGATVGSKRAGTD